MGGVGLTHRVRLCYLLFTSLILLDVFATTQTLAPLFSSVFTGLNEVSHTDYLTAHNSTHNDTLVLDMDEMVNTVTVHNVMILVVELFGLVMLFLSNATAVLGLRRAEAYLLVPWLFIYLIGICRSDNSMLFQQCSQP
jgi:hypothetical protein